MAEGPIRCTSCGQTDFFVLSLGVSYRGGALVERYRWPERQDEIEGEEMGDGRVFAEDQGYEVEQEILREPEIENVDGPIKALCAGCLADLTPEYLQYGRAESLPV